MKIRRNFFLALLATGVIAAPVAHAVTFTWNGLGADNKASTPANWVGGAAPTPAGFDIIFGNTSTIGNTVDWDYAQNFRSLTFNSTALAYTIAGATPIQFITAGIDAIVNSATNPQIITDTVNVFFNGSKGFNASGAGGLTLTNVNLRGDALAAGNVNTLTLTGTANGTISGIIANVGAVTAANAALVKAGAGTWSLTGTSAYVFPTTVNAGVLQVTGPTGKITGTSVLTVSTGGTFIDGDPTTAANNDGVVDRVNAASTLTLNGGTFTLAAADVGTHTQSFNALATGGGGTGTFNASAVTGTNNLVFAGTSAGNYIHNVGGLLNINTQTGFNPSFTNAPTGSSVAGTGVDAILIGATLNNVDFITAAAGGLVAAPLTLTGSDTWTAGKNMDVTGSNPTPYAVANVNSVRFNQAAANHVTLATGTHAIAGGILVTAAVGPNGSTITGGSIAGAVGKDLVVTNLNNGAGGTLIIGSAIVDNAGATGLTKGGAFPLTLTGINTYTGLTTINGGTLSLGDGSADSSIANSSGIANYGALVFNLLGNQSYSKPITGTGALTKNNAGTLTLSGANTFSGLTTVSAGTLKGGSANFGGLGALTVSGGTVDLNGYGASFTAINAGTAAGTITNTGTTAVLGMSNQAVTITNLIQGNVQIVYSAGNLGISPFALGNANTFNGGLTMLGSTSSNRINVNAPMTGTPFGSGPITIGLAAADKAQFMIASAAPNTTLPNDWVINTSQGTDSVGTWRVDSAGNVFSGKITANLADAVFRGTGAVTLTGQVTGPYGLSSSTAANTVTLNNATANPNNYLGTTNIATGAKLVLGAANQIPNGLGSGNVANSGTLNLGGFSETINALSGGTTGIVDGVSGTPLLTLGENHASATFSGVIKNTAGTLSLTKNGTGKQTLSGINTYTGATTVNNGTLALGISGTTGASLAATDVTVHSGATFAATPGALTTTANSSVGGGLTLDAGSGFSMADNFANSFVVGGAASLSPATGVAPTLSFDIGGGTSTADQLVINGVVTLGAVKPVIKINGIGALATGGTYNLISAPAGGLGSDANFTLGNVIPAVGNGTLYSLTLSGTDTALDVVPATMTGFYWTGTLNASWQVPNNFADAADGSGSPGVPNSSSNVVLTATAAANLATTLDGNVTVSNLTFNGTGTANTAGSSIATGVGTNTLTIDAAANGGNIAGNGIYVAPGSGANTISADVTLGSSQSWTNDSASNLTVSGAIGDVNGYTLTKAGGGSIILQGVNTYTGATQVNAGSLYLRNQSAIAGGAVTVASGARLQIAALADAQTFELPAFPLALNGNGSTIDLEFTEKNTCTYNVNSAITLTGGAIIRGYGINNSYNLKAAIGGDATAYGVVFRVGGATQNTYNLAVASNYTGNTTLAAEANVQANLALGIADALPTTTSLNFTSTTAAKPASLNLAGFAQTLAGLSTGAIPGGAQVINSVNATRAALTVSGAADTLYAGTLGSSTAATSNISLTKGGAGTLTLASANLHIGDTKITGGVLSLTHPLALQNSAFDTSGAGSMKLRDTAVTFGGLKGATNLATAINSGYGNLMSLVLNPATSVSNTYSGAIANGASNMTLTKNGAGTQILSGTNTYSGATLVNAGTLQYNSVAALPSATAVTVAANAVLFLNAPAGGTETAPTVHTFSNNIAVNGSAATIFEADGNNRYNLTGTITLSGSNQFRHYSNYGYTVFDGKITGTPGGAADNLTLLGGAGGLNSSQRFVFNNYNNDYDGTTTLLANFGANTVLQMGTTYVLPATTTVILNSSWGAPAVNRGPTKTGSLLGANAPLLELQNTTQSVLGLTTVGGGNGSGGTSDRRVVWGGLSAPTSGTEMGGTLFLTGTANSIDVGGAAGTALLIKSVTVSQTGAGSKANIGTGLTLELLGGATLQTKGVQGAGKLVLNGGTLQVGSSPGASWVAATAEIALYDTAVPSVTNTIDTNGQAATIDAVMANFDTSAAGFTKSGVGMLTLSNTNTYTGATTINGGTLTLASGGSIATSSAVIIGAGAKLNTAAHPDYILPSTQPVTFKLDGAGAGSSGQIEATGGLDIANAAVLFDIVNPLDDAVYVIATYGPGSLGGTAFGSVTAPGGYTIQYNYNGGTQIALVQDTTDYGTWMNAYTSITDPADKLPGADPDHDGLTNQQEYAFGLDPSSGSSVNPITVPLNVTAGTFTYTRRKPALTGLNSYRIWISTTLDAGDWDEDIGAYFSQVATDIPSSDNQSVVVTLSGAPLTAPKTFVRVSAE